jgi:hypothetical protein
MKNYPINEADMSEYVATLMDRAVRYAYETNTGTGAYYIPSLQMWSIRRDGEELIRTPDASEAAIVYNRNI